MKSWAKAARAADSTRASSTSSQPVGDVGAHGVVEEHRLLRHEADLLAQARERRVAHVDAVDQDRALGHVVEARQQVDERGLAGAARAHDRHHLARGAPEARRAAARAPSRVGVAEAHLAVLDPAAHPRQHHGVPAPRGTSSWRVEHLEDARSAAASAALQRGVHPREPLDRRVHREERGQERDEGAGGEVPAADRRSCRRRARRPGPARPPPPSAAAGSRSCA